MDSVTLQAGLASEFVGVICAAPGALSKGRIVLIASSLTAPSPVLRHFYALIFRSVTHAINRQQVQQMFLSHHQAGNSCSRTLLAPRGSASRPSAIISPAGHPRRSMEISGSVLGNGWHGLLGDELRRGSPLLPLLLLNVEQRQGVKQVGRALRSRELRDRSSSR